ncbi:peptidoglycan DD-metalloendopeptidase family protein [Aeromonas simiae]|uniref:peptidoglycan DD-metalloendopeptidase family protein n=1 Tax=Aeromonas simiae TaxID=218936 RepID=UPI0005A7D75D|nr:peptidoglycan DD-metalloendopeptidase family protein [Aeromonas simiae]MDO2948246.1 peptidoglycan DD-metalloendopeptidase family protein [Aeromonas simiae]MDO2951727.1 peptidoglycan DD-metalloendopeptidase family protein [Aeromonas simiae]MDO2955565.1 peptidoglycan DD-metalloendopeptidase family protein [Aeromonas simiae]
MSITLIFNGKRRRRLHIPRISLLGMGVLLCSLAGAGSWAIWQHWQTRIDTLELALDLAQSQAEGSAEEASKQQLAMLAAQVGTMQAQLGRLNALGERLTEEADLDPDEFNFNELPPMGGPSYDPDLEVGLNELQQSMQNLSYQLGNREEQLAVLESFMMNHNIADKGLIDGEPVAGRRAWVSSGFGGRVDPFNGRAKMHKGIDFRGKVGTPILASGPGVVSWSGRHPEFGIMVEISHGNGLVTRYAHNSKALVQVGTLVDKGQRIALMGRTGRATGVHLHYEVLKDGRQVNPSRFMTVRRG